MTARRNRTRRNHRVRFGFVAIFCASVAGFAAMPAQAQMPADLLARNKAPTREQIVEHMDGNICRCGTYLKIISAIQRAAREG